ncbi:MAG: sulfurtransferase [Methanotrichaceae archaeon]
MSICAIGILLLTATLMMGGVYADSKVNWSCPTCSGSSSDLWGGPAWANIANSDNSESTWGSSNEADNSIETPWGEAAENTKPVTPQQDRAEMEASKTENEKDLVEYDGLISAKDVTGSYVTIYVDAEDFHIKGAIPLYWEEFLDDENKLKSVSEMSQVLGDAGISNNDSVVIYGDCPDCGGKSVATFVFWVMRYLGHENVKVLDGGIEAWKAAGLPVESTPNSRPALTYTPNSRPDFLASYDLVTSGEVQLVDARSLEEFARDKIPGAIHIGYQEVMDNGRIKNSEDLADLFEGLNKDKPVVVYSQAGVKASMVWYALQIMGYESSIYTWNDWMANQPSTTVLLKNVYASPNPSGPGLVKIYATIEVVEDESVLTTLGCATCTSMVNQYLHAGDSSSSANTIRLGSSGSGPVTAGALIRNQDHEEIAKITMTHLTGDQYVGTWDASEVAAGFYNVSLAASSGGEVRYFEDVLTIEISNSVQKTTTDYRKLGSY